MVAVGRERDTNTLHQTSAININNNYGNGNNSVVLGIKRKP